MSARRVACNTAAVTDNGSTRIEGRLRWIDTHDVYNSAPLVNQIAMQVSPGPDNQGIDALLLTFGFAAGPLLIGSQADQRKQVERLAEASDDGLLVTIQPIARVAVSIEQARRLHSLLGVPALRPGG